MHYFFCIIADRTKGIDALLIFGGKNMKQQILTVCLAILSITSIGSKASADAATFTESGSADVTSPPIEAESDMQTKAQAQCKLGTLAEQVTATEFALYPHSYPTKRIATATFVCQQNQVSISQEHEQIVKCSEIGSEDECYNAGCTWIWVPQHYFGPLPINGR